MRHQEGEKHLARALFAYWYHLHKYQEKSTGFFWYCSVRSSGRYSEGDFPSYSSWFNLLQQGRFFRVLHTAWNVRLRRHAAFGALAGRRCWAASESTQDGGFFPSTRSIAGTTSSGPRTRMIFDFGALAWMMLRTRLNQTVVSSVAGKFTASCPLM